MDVAPAQLAGAVAGGDVGGGTSVEHGIADPALQGTTPDGFEFAAAALVVAVVPLGHFAHFEGVGPAFDASAHVAEEQLLGTFLFGDGVPHLPEKDDAIGVGIPVSDGVEGRKLLARRAVAGRQFADIGPRVGEEAIDGVAQVDLVEDRRHVLRHVGGEDAGVEK